MAVQDNETAGQAKTDHVQLGVQLQGAAIISQLRLEAELQFLNQAAPKQRQGVVGIQLQQPVHAAAGVPKLVFVEIQADKRLQRTDRFRTVSSRALEQE